MRLTIPNGEVEYMLHLLKSQYGVYQGEREHINRLPDETREQYNERYLRTANRESFLKDAVKQLEADLKL